MSKHGNPPLSDVERIKASSNFLRGTLHESLHNGVTGAIAEDDTQLCKFHGIYQQDDRDLRSERRQQKLEPAYSFMIRVRVPGGICTPSQWLAMDDLARRYANDTLRLTTRQALQFHGVLKRNLKSTLAAINAGLLDTIAACGDVNRNVMCSPNPVDSRVHQEVYQYAQKISEHLTPRTTAYHEIWLNGKKAISTQQDKEPIYGETYLPRKFKTAVVVPPHNDVDVFAHDLGFIAIVENGRLCGFNLSVGGGMGMTHGEPATFPRLADVIGFCQLHEVVDVAEKVVAVQRDYGDRTDRKHARLKYTIEDRGIDWFRNELEQRLGWSLESARDTRFTSTGDRYGWTQGVEGNWHLTLFVENGRIKDSKDLGLLTGLREVAKIHQGEFRITPNQNLIIANVKPAQKDDIQSMVVRYRLDGTEHLSKLRLNAMACVGFPTCGQSMAESERYLPDLLGKIEGIAQGYNLDKEILVRMTGCPNGCARPYLAEIGLVGKGPGKYNLYLGANFTGQRLNRLYRESLSEAEILAELEPLLAQYASERETDERFGDYLIRSGKVKAVTAGREFHGEFLKNAMQ